VSDEFRFDPDDPSSIYRDRPPGQTVNSRLRGTTASGHDLEMTIAVTLPDNLRATEQAAHDVAHRAWHALAGPSEPTSEAYELEGDYDPVARRATLDAIKRAEEQAAAFADFIKRVHKTAPPKEKIRWN
jgi:hypothetical protein